LRTQGIPYVLPRDLEELNRLDFQHYLLHYAFQGNYAAPIGQPRDILDVGTGTGRWAYEMAALFPQTQVVGLDVNPPPADERATVGSADTRPTNYSFVSGNVLEGLPFADASFDFVHMRLLVLAIPHDRWPFVVNELVRVTRIGGWVESVEAGPLLRGGPATDLIMSWIIELLARRGIAFADGSQVSGLLHAAGLANIVAQQITLPFGVYGERIGNLLATDFFTGMKGYGGLLEAQGVTTAAQFDETVAMARADTAQPQTRCVSPFYIAFGQRAK
jgi:ubiquinone/menaquinone biosynthesis C-methylase UbiE